MGSKSQSFLVSSRLPRESPSCCPSLSPRSTQTSSRLAPRLLRDDPFSGPARCTLPRATSFAQDQTSRVQLAKGSRLGRTPKTRTACLGQTSCLGKRSAPQAPPAWRGGHTPLPTCSKRLSKCRTSKCRLRSSRVSRSARFPGPRTDTGSWWPGRAREARNLEVQGLPKGGATASLRGCTRKNLQEVVGQPPQQQCPSLRPCVTRRTTNTAAWSRRSFWAEAPQTGRAGRSRCK
mmetsp:Transcript_36214/g.71734  ORF Transcript_36214/g.71734 Transcript_36214/m.71734 type:complete len:234 (-) Transcript_36214:889-1590(-)